MSRQTSTVAWPISSASPGCAAGGSHREHQQRGSATIEQIGEIRPAGRSISQIAAGVVLQTSQTEQQKRDPGAVAVVNAGRIDQDVSALALDTAVVAPPPDCRPWCTNRDGRRK